jgi:ribose/xylose/arabinose/galactoside ABC-type transport system permease subunit
MIKSLVRQRFFVILVLLILMIIFFALTQERFFTVSNFTVILTSSSILWVAAMGLTFVMIAGGFDLSVGSMMALCGIALGYFSNQLDLNLAVAIFLTLLFGVVVGGVINGLAIGKLGLSFLVVTLGSSTLFIGLTQFWSGTKTSAIENQNLQILAYDSLFFIPNQVVVMILVYLILLYVQKFTLFGRDIYAIGGNIEAAKLSGINTSRILVLVYALAAGFAALAGVIQDARIGAASPQVGQNLIFTATAAVLLGGTSFSGGVGGVSGTVVGVLFLGVLQNGLSVAGVADYWQLIVTGLILIGAIALDALQQKRRSSSVRAASDQK